MQALTSGLKWFVLIDFLAHLPVSVSRPVSLPAPPHFDSPSRPTPPPPPRGATMLLAYG